MRATSREITTLYLDPDSRRRLRLTAGVLGCSQAAIIRNALDYSLAELEAGNPTVARVLKAAA